MGYHLSGDMFLPEGALRNCEGSPGPPGPARLQKRTQKNPARLPSGTQVLEAFQGARNCVEFDRGNPNSRKNGNRVGPNIGRNRPGESETNPNPPNRMPNRSEN